MNVNGRDASRCGVSAASASKKAGMSLVRVVRRPVSGVRVSGLSGLPRYCRKGRSDPAAMVGGQESTGM